MIIIECGDEYRIECDPRTQKVIRVLRYGEPVNDTATKQILEESFCMGSTMWCKPGTALNAIALFIEYGNFDRINVTGGMVTIPGKKGVIY